MLVYSSTKSAFAEDVRNNRIDTKILAAFRHALGRTTSPNEIASWRNSMQYMNNVLADPAIPVDAGVSIEYKLPQSNKRIDFILTGKNAGKADTAIIVELKQWEHASVTTKDGIVSTRFARGRHEVAHPSYQAWTYAALLEDFNETVRNERIQLKPCVYLHNCVSRDAINDSRYAEHTSKAPAFLKDDAQRLCDFIKQNVVYGDNDRIMYRIDHGKIRPSRNLADQLLSMLQGNPAFLMIDDQKLVYETGLELAAKAAADNKHVLIVEGGPGTGKSVVAVNMLVAITNREQLVQYVTKNAAPRTVYEAKLTGSFKKSHITNLFRGSGAFTQCEPDIFDVLVVDEAHRLTERSGMFQNMGENQIKEIIKAAKCSIFFIDEDQRVTLKDIGEKREIKRWARQLNATVHELKLESQFRCNGSDGYLAWVDNALQIRRTANETLEDVPYEFRVFDSPNDLRDAIFEKNRISNKARLVAGYCWDWVSKKEGAAGAMDIVLPEHGFAMKWNLATDGNLWIVKPESVSEVGCIHTCQGLEVDYVGVIIGPDLIVRDGEVRTDATKRARMDASVKGYKARYRDDPEGAKSKADTIIKNTYRTLMTRGAKGCYLYCTDVETREWFARQVGRAGAQQADSGIPYPNLPLRLLKPQEVRPFENAVPIVDLKVAAGAFSDVQTVDEFARDGGFISGDGDWAELPDTFRARPGLFVAQVVGQSMNRRIPDGAWCLFRFNPGGSRQGKIVIVQHRDIADPETGGHYTVKLYESEKGAALEGSWRHTRIWLKPVTNAPGYEAMAFEGEDAAELKVIAELVAVL